MSDKTVLETIRTVLSVRAYQDRPISEQSLTRILEAARLTASGMNRQPWQFLVVQDRAMLRKLGESLGNGPYIADAAAAILVLVTSGRNASTDAARAIQSMVLQAWSEGIGSNWVGAAGIDPVKTELGIPGELEIVAVLPLGYPKDAIGKGIKSRKPLSEIAHRERWSESWD